jgi:hypothetical protein
MQPGLPQVRSAWAIMAKLLWCRVCGMTAIDLTGGETMLHPAIDRLISFAFKIGYSEVRLLTNGTMKNTATLLASRFPGLRFSVSCHSHLPEELAEIGQSVWYSKQVFPFLKEFADRINYINICPSMINKHFEDTPLAIHNMVPDAGICLKMLGYETGATVPKWLDYAKVNTGARNLLSADPCARVDFRCFGHCQHKPGH